MCVTARREAASRAASAAVWAVAEPSPVRGGGEAKRIFIRPVADDEPAQRYRRRKVFAARFLR